MSKLHGLNMARFSVLISDQFQGQGLGKELVRRIVEVAKKEHLEQISAFITPDNKPMRHIAIGLGFSVKQADEHGMVEIQYDLPVK